MSGAVVDRLAAALSDRYTIERELGAGGMATVYLAHDLKHDRDVAIKVLHPDLGAALGGERFLSEIRTTARLQHPHILPLLDSGDADGLLYYVMPLVTGETLRSRLERERQLPIDDAVLIAREVADALGYAHGLGVIHRDIKPENILLQGGHALVADFGIALAVQTAGGARMTQTGLSLGTPQYMSPEQAMGEKQIDARSDIYALGAVTYEMLTGEAPFTGPSVQAIVARLITEEPRGIAAQRKAVPEHVEAAVLHALEKLPADRFATAVEFAAALAGATVASTLSRSSARRGTAAAKGARHPAWMVVAAVLLGLATAGGWWLGRRGGNADVGPTIFDAGLPDSAAMFFTGQTAATPYGSAMQNLSLSSDGSTVVYLAQSGESTMLWRRNLRDATVAPISGTEGASMPRISPDGTQIAFIASPGITLVPISGGQARRVVETDGQVTSLDWTSDTRLIATDAEGFRARILDTQTGEVEAHPIARCIDGSWFPEMQQLVCNLGGVGRVIDPKTGVALLIRSRGLDGAAPVALVGSAIRIIDGKYLVFTAPEGDLRGARYDPETQLIGRS
ncbi:MAG: protein kinase, partial [Gemmatimonadota bacterium]